MQNVADLGSLISTAIHPTSLDANDQGSFGQVISRTRLGITHPVPTDWVRRLTHLLPSDGSAFALACSMCV